MLNEEIFMKYITALAEMYAPKPLSDVVMEMYYLVLKDMNEKDFISSVEKLMSEWSYSYMPKPAHIKNALVDSVSLEVEANKEWNIVMKAIENFGSYKNVRFENIVTNGTIQSLTGGKWSELCKKTYEQLDWIKKDFIKLYQNFRKNPTKANTDTLLGLTSETSTLLIESSVKDTKILKSNQIKSKIDSKKQHINKLVAKSIKTF
jgi:hypothetical protein